MKNEFMVWVVMRGRHTGEYVTLLQAARMADSYACSVDIYDKPFGRSLGSFIKWFNGSRVWVY